VACSWDFPGMFLKKTFEFRQWPYCLRKSCQYISRCWWIYVLLTRGVRKNQTNSSVDVPAADVTYTELFSELVYLSVVCLKMLCVIQIMQRRMKGWKWPWRNLSCYPGICLSDFGRKLVIVTVVGIGWDCLYGTGLLTGLIFFPSW
jgi:hypothetical protein